jgi:hypothetical protein
MGNLPLTRTVSGEIAPRRTLLRPPEPPPHYLCSPARGVYIGRTKMLSTPFFWDPSLLVNPHMAIIGLSGTGKSYLVKTLLTRSSLFYNSNAIILDWAGEYAPWVAKAGGTIIRLGKPDSLNLLDLCGMPPQIRSRQIISALSILTDLPQFPTQLRLTQSAIERAYAVKGMKMGSQSKKRPPTLRDVAKILKSDLSNVRKSGNSMLLPELEASLFRISQLTVPGSDYFASRSRFPLERIICAGLVCIDLHHLPTEELRSLAGLTILQFVKERMRSSGYKDSSGIDLFVVADEAWKIAKDERSELVSIVREGRKYRFALIVASQNPTDVSQTIFSNSGTIFLFRTAHAEFKSYLRSSLGYSDFIAGWVEKLGLGEAAVHLKFSANPGFSDTFLLSKIEGEEPMASYVLGGGMELEFEKDEFRRRLLEAGIPPTCAAEACAQFDSAGGSLDCARLVLALEKSGAQRAAILSALRNLGLKERHISSAFARLRSQEAHAQGAELTSLSAKKR